MDVGLVSFVIASLAVDWHLDKTVTSWIASVGFIGMAIGATFGGLLADRYGRRSIFSVTLLVYGIATGASALATSVTCSSSSVSSPAWVSARSFPSPRRS